MAFCCCVGLATWQGDKLQQLSLGTARQLRRKWSAHEWVEQHVHDALLTSFQE
jgi:hypothetical protein